MVAKAGGLVGIHLGPHDLRRHASRFYESIKHISTEAEALALIQG